MTDLTSLTASDLAAAIRARRVSATEVMGAYLDRIDRINPSLNAVLHVDAEQSLAAAARADSLGGPRGLLHGVPMTLKDSHRVAGMPTIVGNPDASRARAANDGFVSQRLRAEGAIVIGKTNVARDLADFQTENPVFGRTSHPSDPALTPGGSSGGAAAALAARLTPIEVGSDIAGSVRIPAHFTGVIGFKPSAGLIPRRGHVTQPVMHQRGGGVGALATIGPMARSLDDIGLLTSLLGNLRSRNRLQASVATLGVLTELPGLRVQASIRDAVISFAKSAEGHGMPVELIEPPLGSDEQHEAWVEVYQAARISGGSWRRVAGAARNQALAFRAWERALRRHQAIILPPAMCVAFSHRPAGTPIDIDEKQVPYWGLARYTEPFNLTGHPAIVLPSGRDGDGLPVGVQMVAGFGRDGHLLRLAAGLASLELVDAPPSI